LAISDLTATPARRWLAAAAGVAVAYVLGSRLLPGGLPLEVIIPGLIFGALSSLTAMGLVLIHRSTRIINFAQANMGGIVATLVVLLVAVWHWNYWLACAAGLVAAVFLGTQIEKAWISWFSTAPRLILTVVTIGIAQLLAATTLLLLRFFGQTNRIGSIIPFHTPVGGQVTVGTLLLTGDHLVAVVAVLLVLGALVFFLSRTDAGIGARGAADSLERAQLLGIPVKQLSMLTWVVASVLSALGAILSAGVQGFQSTLLPGPEALLIPLAAAVIAGFESLTVAFAASLAIGVIQGAVFWSYRQNSVVDVVIFAVILLALVLRRRSASRVGGEDLGGFVALWEPRPLPDQIRNLPEVRALLVGGLGIAMVACAVVPLWLNNSTLTFFAFACIFVMVATSLIVLTGWGGQVSLGQFAFVGLGAGTTGWLLTTHHASLLLCLVASTLVGIAASLAIGIPALRIRGSYLAAATLAFSVPASSFFLSSVHFPAFTPVLVVPPVLFGRFNLSEARPFYYLCLLGALVTLGLARNFRTSRPGRAAIAVRDNERMAEAVAISVTRTRLVTFAVSGALAGMAGGLYVLAYRGVPFGGFAPVLGLEAFAMVVVGGMGSLWGAVLGALYVFGAQKILGAQEAQLVVTGGGILLVLQFSPGGLAQLGYRLRDLALMPILRRRGLSRNLLYARPDEGVSPSFGWRDRIAAAQAAMKRSMTTFRNRRTKGQSAVFAGDELLVCKELEGGYGHLKILFGIDFEVRQGEIFALLGTNGAGKSTVLKAITGVLRADSGQVIFAGEDITHLKPADRVRRGVVLVPGGRGVFGSLTVKENLRLAGWLARRDRDREFIDRTMERIFELFPVLRDRQGQKASLLSGGEQQMLTIAQALLCRPKLLMIDELSLGLAPVVVGNLLEVLRTLNASGITVLMVEQSMNIATSAAPRAVFLEKGAVRFTGATAELAKSGELVRSVFLGDAVTTRRKGGATVNDSAVNGRAAESLPVALSVTAIEKAYGGVRAVAGVDLEVRTGEILGVIGANGAGKTTLFDIISGAIRPDAGRITLHSRDVTSFSASRRASLGLGRTFQDLKLIPSMTVAEVVGLAHERHVDVREPLASILSVPAVLRSEASVRRRVDELLATFKLERFANSFISELSTGTRRVVELACACAHRPSVLILDEPSSGLAQSEAEAMIDLIVDIKERTGAAIALIEHDMQVITGLSNEVVCMHLGAVIARGTPQSVLANPEVISAYLGFDDVAVQRSGRATRSPKGASTAGSPGAVGARA
jgi:ABC-type branched-subunit amino acid transport system ATPase component/ABC-type branched-subunit amino acid transport system permease subunit